MATQGLGGRGQRVSAKVKKPNPCTNDSGSHQVSVVGHEDEHQEEPDKDLCHVK